MSCEQIYSHNTTCCRKVTLVITVGKMDVAIQGNPGRKSVGGRNKPEVINTL